MHDSVLNRPCECLFAAVAKWWPMRLVGMRGGVYRRRVGGGVGRSGRGRFFSLSQEGKTSHGVFFFIISQVIDSIYEHFEAYMWDEKAIVCTT